jgi:YD repeat-containing protein
MRHDAISKNGLQVRYRIVSVARRDPVRPCHLRQRSFEPLHKLGVNTLGWGEYGYDLAGNRPSKTNQLNSTVSNYGYDNTYQLTGVTQEATGTEAYTFDPVGNRLSSLSVLS